MKTHFNFPVFQAVGFIGLLLILFSFRLPCIAKTKSEPWQPLVQDDIGLSRELQKISRKYHQPAMGAALLVGTDIVAKATVGSVVVDGEQKVNIDSRFHLGSVTKSMTALLIAILVNEGNLSYDMTLEQALPDIPMLAVYRQVTVRDLLLHRSGIIAFQQTDCEDPAIVRRFWEEVPGNNSDPGWQRKEIAQVALSLKPIAQPGEKTIYSNVGYAIIGLIAEKVTRQPYEKLLQEKIFKPLGMNHTRIGGWPASSNEPDQPRGHYAPGRVVKKGIKPQPLDDSYIFPAWMNPSGGVHCSIGDYALYARENLLGLNGKGKLLTKAGYQQIHTVHSTVKASEMYVNIKGNQKITLGYGWAVIPEGENLLSVADGSGGTFYARIIIYPALNLAFAGFTNCGNGDQALDATIKRLTGFDWES